LTAVNPFFLPEISPYPAFLPVIGHKREFWQNG